MPKAALPLNGSRFTCYGKRNGHLKKTSMLVQIASYTTPLEAHLARGRLESEDITAFVFDENHVWSNWMLSTALHGVKLHVYAKDAERAKTIIESHNRGEFALEETNETAICCPRCNGIEIERGRLSWKSALLVANLANIPLYFRWATLKCRRCDHEWDLPSTNEHSPWVIAAGLLVIIVTAAIAFSVIGFIYCGIDASVSLFPKSMGCAR